MRGECVCSAYGDTQRHFRTVRNLHGRLLTLYAVSQQILPVWDESRENVLRIQAIEKETPVNLERRSVISGDHYKVKTLNASRTVIATRPPCAR